MSRSLVRLRALALVMLFPAWLACHPNPILRSWFPPPTEHLEPEEGILSSRVSIAYLAKVREQLLPEGGFRHYAVIVCFPSFSPEWALVLSPPVDDSARLELRTAETPIWNGGGAPYTVAVTRQAIQVPARVADAVFQAWHSVLVETRPPTPSGWSVLDGTSYDFATWVPKLGVLSGRTVSPERGKRPGELVALARELRNLVADSGSSQQEQQAIVRHSTALSHHEDLSVYEPPPDPGLVVVYRDQPGMHVSRMIHDSLFSVTAAGRFPLALRSWQPVETKRGETAILITLSNPAYRDSIRIVLANNPWVKRIVDAKVPRRW